MASTVDDFGARGGGRLTAPVPSTGADPVPDLDGRAARLVRGLLSQPWGQLTPSVYETARLVTLAPWLTGAARRVAYLLAAQEPDGGWGTHPDRGYRLAPTLSAVEALLTVAGRDRPAEWPVGGPAAVARAADRGLRAVRRWLDELSAVPDTPAIELIAPALVGAVNGHLDRLGAHPVTGLDAWHTGRLPVPACVDLGPATKVRALLAGGGPVPAKLLHSLEVAGVPAEVRPVPVPLGGHPAATVGASPAATAAWLAGAPHRDPGAVRYLEEVAARHGGPVPSVIPITMFERSWVLSTLRYAGFTPAADAVADELAAALGASGTPGGAGLPPDADTTSVVLLSLAQLGRRPDLECLWAYQVDDHFCVWPGERTVSVTANAHVLEALGHQVTHRAPAAARYTATVDAVARWLADRQRPDGSWADKWHASPYYATCGVALALHRYAGPRYAPAVARAVDWVLSTQDGDGSWGRWGGTVEETAYAVQLLVATGHRTASERGGRYLRAAYGQQSDPPLWHDKDLYRPVAVVRSAALAALRLATRHARRTSDRQA